MLMIWSEERASVGAVKPLELDAAARSSAAFSSSLEIAVVVLLLDTSPEG
jgi:hypothetical protein